MCITHMQGENYQLYSIKQISNYIVDNKYNQLLK